MIKNILLIICIIILRVLTIIFYRIDSTVIFSIIATYASILLCGVVEYNILCRWIKCKKLIRFIVIIQIIVFTIAYSFLYK